METSRIYSEDVWRVVLKTNSNRSALSGSSQGHVNEVDCFLVSGLKPFSPEAIYLRDAISRRVRSIAFATDISLNVSKYARFSIPFARLNKLRQKK